MDNKTNTRDSEMCPMALILEIMDTTHFEIKHPCDTSINGLYHRGMIDSLIDLVQWTTLGQREGQSQKRMILHNGKKYRVY